MLHSHSGRLHAAKGRRAREPGTQLLPAERLVQQHSLAAPRRESEPSKPWTEAEPACRPEGRYLCPGRPGGKELAGCTLALLCSSVSEAVPRHREVLGHVSSARDATGLEGLGQEPQTCSFRANSLCQLEPGCCPMKTAPFPGSKPFWT